LAFVEGPPPDVDGVTGKFFVNGRSKTANKVAHDPGAMARLWQISSDLVGMKPAIS